MTLQDEVIAAIRNPDKGAKQKIVLDGVEFQADLNEKTKKEKAKAEFSEPDLMKRIFKELDRDHKDDDAAKMLIFTTMFNGVVESPQRRFSSRAIGDSTAGKDSLIETCARHLPKGSFLKLTGESEKFLQRASLIPPIVYFGEVNWRTQKINPQRIELLKALAEGGVSYCWLDNFGRDEMNTVIERRTVLYSSTAYYTDDELENRFITASVKGTPEQTKEVLALTTARHSKPELLWEEERGESWIAEGIKTMLEAREKEGYCRVLIPFLPIVENYIDFQYPRARRDYKRLIGVITAITNLHRYQRKKMMYAKGNFLVAHPADLFYAMEVIGDSLNRSYSLVEPRLQKAIVLIEEMEQRLDKEGVSTWIPQKDVIKKLGITDRHKQKDILEHLEELLIIERQQNQIDKRQLELRLTGKSGVPLITKTPRELYDEALNSLSTTAYYQKDEVELCPIFN